MDNTSTRSDIATKLDQQLNLRDCSIAKQSVEEARPDRNFDFQHYDEDEDEDEDSSDFSFACAEAASSPISAADLFHNGQIRPISPVFGAVAFPLKEAFVERSDLPAATSCRKEEAKTETAAKPPVSCRKSNSTGFSKLWRFRDLLIRSQSDGKEKFVFLTENETTSCSSLRKNKSQISRNDKISSSRNAKKGSAIAESKTTPSKSKGKTTSSSSSSSYAMYYGKNGEKEREKRRSYLPYRQDLVGFFTNANAVTRNIHPY